MKLDEAKILIGDDSILARKQLKDIIAQYGGTTLLRQQMVRKQLTNSNPINLISFS